MIGIKTKLKGLELDKFGGAYMPGPGGSSCATGPSRDVKGASPIYM